ncbi:MAG: phosphoenolpyruvate carboxylase, partial [Kangiellaceae bacterium]|nr:phosphoenolpyruvate carboxylase [Kangiellaceae bacterium]
GREYLSLNKSKKAGEIFNIIETEYKKSVRYLLLITGEQNLLDHNKPLQRTLGLRNPYLDPISFIQVNLIKKYRQKQGSKKEKESLMGCVVDGVSDVFNLEESFIRDIPEYGSDIDSRFTSGIMTVNNNAVTLLNLENLLDLNLINHPYSGGQVVNG